VPVSFTATSVFAMILDPWFVIKLT